MPSVWRGPITCRRGSIPHRLTGAVVGFLSTASTTRIPPVRCPRTGESAPLTITEQSRGGGGGGTTKYEVRYECTQRGAHSIHVQLRGEEIVGSPVNFDVGAAALGLLWFGFIPGLAATAFTGLYAAKEIEQVGRVVAKVEQLGFTDYIQRVIISGCWAGAAGAAGVARGLRHLHGREAASI